MQASDIKRPASPKPPESPIYTYIVGLVTIVAVLAAGWLGIQYQKHIREIAQIEATTADLTLQYEAKLAAASTTIATLHAEQETLRKNLDNLADDYADEKNRNEEFEDQIRQLSGTIGDLDKLAKTDKELLQKYSKVYFLNENYIPERLKQIDDKYILGGKKDQYFHARAVDFLNDMLRAAARDDIDLKVVSAYRSFDEQTDLKGQYTQVYGSGANTFSADQGYSEHQLGTTVDLTTTSIGGAYTSFKDTEAYQWLLDNGYKYGFIESYPEGNSFYVFEPWHWRFVGTDLARDLRRDDAHFYDWEQRKIDEYLISIFD